MKFPYFYLPALAFFSHFILYHLILLIHWNCNESSESSLFFSSELFALDNKHGPSTGCLWNGFLWDSLKKTVTYRKPCLADGVIFSGLSLRHICLSTCLFYPSVRLPLSFPLPRRLSVHLYACVCRRQRRWSRPLSVLRIWSSASWREKAALKKRRRRSADSCWRRRQSITGVWAKGR